MATNHGGSSVPRSTKQAGIDFGRSYTVPQRFNTLTLLILTTAAAAVCSILRAYQAVPIVYLAILGWFAISGISIACFPMAPRQSAMLSAVIVAVIGAIVGFGINFGLGCALLVFVLFAPAFGYVTGVVFVSIFMFTDFLDQWLGRRRTGVASEVVLAELWHPGEPGPWTENEAPQAPANAIESRPE